MARKPEQRQRESPNGSNRANLPPRGRPSPIPPVPAAHQYSIADLERETGFNARTIRYYITKGLLPPAHGRGPSATYDLGHLLRLRLIQLLKAEFVPLEEIKERLTLLSDREIAAMLDVRTRPPEDHWRRIELHPDIELHIRYAGGQEPNPALEEAVDLIIGLSRPVIERLEEES